MRSAFRNRRRQIWSEWHPRHLCTRHQRELIATTDDLAERTVESDAPIDREHGALNNVADLARQLLTAPDEVEDDVIRGHAACEHDRSASAKRHTAGDVEDEVIARAAAQGDVVLAAE